MGNAFLVFAIVLVGVFKYETVTVSVDQYIIKFENCTVTKYKKYERVEHSKIPKHQNIKISKKQDVKMQKCINIKASRHQMFKISMYHNVEVWETSLLESSGMRGEEYFEGG